MATPAIAAGSTTPNTAIITPKTAARGTAAPAALMPAAPAVAAPAAIAAPIATGPMAATAAPTTAANAPAAAAAIAPNVIVSSHPSVRPNALLSSSATAAAAAAPGSSTAPIVPVAPAAPDVSTEAYGSAPQRRSTVTRRGDRSSRWCSAVHHSRDATKKSSTCCASLVACWCAASAVAIVSTGPATKRSPCPRSHSRACRLAPWSESCCTHGRCPSITWCG